MTPAELQWLSSHLGHDVATHKKNYRLHSTAVEIAKVGRLLLDIEGSLPNEGTVECRDNFNNKFKLSSET